MNKVEYGEDWESSDYTEDYLHSEMEDGEETPDEDDD